MDRVVPSVCGFVAGVSWLELLKKGVLRVCRAVILSRGIDCGASSHLRESDEPPIRAPGASCRPRAGTLDKIDCRTPQSSLSASRFESSRATKCLVFDEGIVG